MSTPETTTLSAQLRAVLALTHTEIKIADTRIAQARTEAARRALSDNAEDARDRARAIEAAIHELGDIPERVAPFLGRGAAAVKAVIDQAQPFDEALLGDLSLEHQLLDRARYIKALATTAGHPGIVALAQRLITAHTETMDWLTTVLTEDALGGPAALRHTRLQTGTGTLVKLGHRGRHSQIRAHGDQTTLPERAAHSPGWCRMGGVADAVCAGGTGVRGSRPPGRCLLLPRQQQTHRR